MQTRQLGPFTVSALGLGCMNMSMGYGKADPDESERVLLGALDAGYSFFDTAAIYGSGHNEQLIGRVMKPHRDRFVLASKCGIHRVEGNTTVIEGRPERIRKTCEQSLRNLQTEVIDLYYLHRPDPQVPIEESIGTLGELVTEGKIRTVGVSEVSTETLRRAHQEFPVTAVQSEYSLWTRTPERQMLRACRELGITFVPFSPLGRGFLCGNSRDTRELDDDDLRATTCRPRFEPDAFAQNSKLLIRFDEIARSLDASKAQLALAWVLTQEAGKLVPIPGTKHLSYMQENAAATELRLSAAVLAELNELINEQTVVGDRYTAKVMAAMDSERD